MKDSDELSPDDLPKIGGKVLRRAAVAVILIGNMDIE